VTRIVALGAGRMGRGIGHVFAYAGYHVDVIDFKARPREDGVQLRDAALAEIGANLGLLRDLGVLDEAQRQAILGRIRILPLEDAPAALAVGDVIFESVTETLDAKRDAFARACAHARADAIIASTTSSMLADDLAAQVTHPACFINAHFLNPAYLIPLVEVSPAKVTAESTFTSIKALLESAGKVVVRCAPSPGWWKRGSPRPRTSIARCARASARATRRWACASSSTMAAWTSCTTPRNRWRVRSVRRATSRRRSSSA